MSSEYLAILQLAHRVAGRDLENARRESIRRYERLTARGVLRYYRPALLREVEHAYNALRHPDTHSARTSSLLAQRAATMARSVDSKPAMSNAITDGSILPNEVAQLKGRSVAHLRSSSDRSDRQVALVEDDFCRAVMHRLEGGLLRYDSRKELLAIADHDGIRQFRANMLMAQITEAVRRNKLYVATRDKSRKGSKRRATGVWLLLAGALVVAAIIDWLLIRSMK